MSDCLCDTCKRGVSWHPIFEFNLSKISRFASSDKEIINYLDNGWLGFYILTQLRYLRVNGYWDGENEAQVLNNILRTMGVIKSLVNQ